MITGEQVADNFFARVKTKNPKDFQRILKKVKAMKKEEKIDFSSSKEFEWCFNDLFYGDVKWERKTLPKNSEFINKIFQTLCSMKNGLNLTLNDTIRLYKNKKMPREERNTINRIRKTLAINPRPIVLTSNNKEYIVYDGWHTIMAFVLEDRDISVFVGKNKSFKCVEKNIK